VAFYAQVMDTVVPVSSPSVAEMVKLLENTFRAVNIGLVNELALMCHRMGLDVWEVIDAAKTKPFGFMPFYPGPGLGGHCIPIDPHYLSWKARQYNFEARFIELAGVINSSMPEFVVHRVADALNTQRKALNGSRVHVIGVAYKRDVNDLRESPALEILELLDKAGAAVSYTDPYFPNFKHGHLDLASVAEKTMHEGVDCGVIVTDHKVFDYPAMVSRFPLLVDTRNALKGVTRDHVFRL
jgi:UDP-N-acetyl-D-glucosamine dehydrogenase